MNRRIVSLVCAGTAVVALSGCAGGSDGGASGAAHRFGGQLIVLQDGEFDPIDPGLTYGSSGYEVVYAMQQPLYRFRPGAAYSGEAPDLATALPTVSADSKTVTVHIRHGVMFSPPVNREVTSADVKYAIERGFSRTVGNPYAGAYFGDLVGAPTAPTRVPEPISGIATPDRYTIVFHLTKPVAPLLAGALVLPLSAPVPESYAAPFDRQNPSTYIDHLVSSGPYMIARNAAGKLTGHQPNVSLLLVRNPNWKRSSATPPAYLDSILIRETARDDSLAVSQALDGHDTVANDATPGSVLEGALKTEPTQLELLTPPGWDNISFNTKIVPLNNLDVRRAIVAAIDRNALLQVVGGPSYGSLQTHYIAPGIPGFSEAGGGSGPAFDFMAHPSGDLALAQAYLKKAGYASGRLPDLTFDLPLTSNGTDRHVGEFLRAQLAPLGITVRPETVTSSKEYDDCLTPAIQPALCQGSWGADFGDGAAMLQVVFDGASIQPQNNYNYSQLSDPAINAAIARADLIPPGASRDRAWARIDELVTADAPGIPQNFNHYYFPQSRDVNGVVTAELGWDYTYTSLK
jgi:peptide/nickel transport system substrate-binding protein